MQRFRQVKALQKFSAAHAALHSHFSQERHLISRANDKTQHLATLAEWKSLAI